jgi:DNA-binding response OmpR family regulator
MRQGLQGIFARRASPRPVCAIARRRFRSTILPASVGQRWEWKKPGGRADMHSSSRILIVDDDEGFRTELAEQLGLHEGCEVLQAANGKAALELAKTHQLDALILDVGLPDTDGRDLCKLIRKAGIKSPIIMLTGHDSDADAILGLDSGANDYVTKPVRLGVLMARLRAQLRQFELSDDATFQVGPYAFKPAAKMLVTEQDRKIHLTEKETAILKYLYRVGDRAVARDTLLDEVWGYNAGVTTHTLETHIYRLRQKIEPVAGDNTLLVTEPGGYRLVR